MLRQKEKTAMSTATETIEGFVKQEYKYGFYTDIETDSAAPGLSEETVRFISKKKNEPEFLLEWRLKAFRHWLTMTEPVWPRCIIRRLIIRRLAIIPLPRSAATGQRVWTKLIRNCSKLMKN